MKAVEIKQLSKIYSGNFHALKEISFDIEQGDFFALLGPNGAGKSTTIGIISSLVNKSSGTVTVFSYDLDKDKNKVKESIGLVPQEFNFNIFEKVYDILIQQAGYYGIDFQEASRRVEKYLKQIDLWEKRNDFAKNLSGGMKRRLMIARAMIHEPKLLILDEPTAGVDIEIRHSLWKFLRHINEQGTTIILTTHYLEEVEELCKNIAIIDKGNILTHTSLKNLLSMTDKQTFVMDLACSIEIPPQIDQLEFKVIDSSSLEVTVPKNMMLNEIFRILTKYKIDILSMRSKGNRLEKLFLKLVQQGNKYES